MITLEDGQLVVRFPEVHKHAMTRISFQRTLRIPDDGNDYPLPPGMGEFPLHHVEDYSARLPEKWARRGGVFMPMYQSEALWINFGSGHHGYPIALQIAAGKINAVTGEPWQEDLQFDPQGYVVTSQQPWLDGFCVEKGRIRQFVAAPLGQGVTVEEQITREAEFGGLQIKAWPLKPGVYERLLRDMPKFNLMDLDEPGMPCVSEASMSMGLGMGGSMKQEIYEDRFNPRDWEVGTSSRCFVHLLNSVNYAHVSGHLPPHRPFEAEDYVAAGLPWFAFYSDQEALAGSAVFKGLKSWREFQGERSEKLLDVNPANVVPLRKTRDGKEVSQGDGD